MLYQIFLVTLLAITFFNQGLYNGIFWFFVPILIFTMTILFIIYQSLQKKKWNSNEFILFLLPFFYGVTLLFGVESVDSTIKEIVMTTLFACLYFLLVRIKRVKASSEIFTNGLIGFSYILIMSTYSVIFGLFSVPNFWLELNTQISGLGSRLGGFLQYPNGFAICVVSLLLFHLMFLTQSLTWKNKSAHYFLLIPYMVLLLFTESRGAIIAFGVSWIIGLFLLEARKQLEYVIASILSGIGSVLLFFGSKEFVQANLVMLFLLVALCLIFSYSSKWFSNDGLVKWKSRFVLPGLVVGLITLLLLDIIYRGIIYHLLPDPLQKRLEVNVDTLNERFIYINDILSVLDQYIWTGAGGDAWRSYMYQVQSSPYISHELHNFFMDVLLELGVFGLTFICLLLAVSLISLIRSKSLVLPSFLAILFHSLIDFSLSFGFIILLLIYYYAMSNHPVKWYKKEPSRRTLLIGVSLVLILLCTVSIYTFRFGQADISYRNQNYEKAFKLNPYNMTYRLAVANADTTNSIAILEDGLYYEPHNSFVIYQLGEKYGQIGNEIKAMQYFEQALLLDPFDASKHQGYIMYLMDTGHYEKAYDVYNHYTSLASQKFKTENQRNFKITKEIVEMMKEGKRE